MSPPMDVESLLAQLSEREKGDVVRMADHAIAALIKEVVEKYRETPMLAILMQSVAVGAAMGTSIAIAELLAQKANCKELRVVSVKVANEVKGLHDQAAANVDEARRKTLAPKKSSSDELVPKRTPPTATSRRPLPRATTQPKKGTATPLRRAIPATVKESKSIPRTPATPVKAGAEPTQADIDAIMELFKSGGVGKA